MFVLTADPPASASERELLARVAGGSVRMFVVLNKTDYLAADDLAEALGFAARVAGEAAGQPVRVYPVSARAALMNGAGDDLGFAAFCADFAAYLDQGRASDLRLSAAAHACRLARSLRDEVDLARRAAGCGPGTPQSGSGRSPRGWPPSRCARRDAADLVRAESARMLADLNEDAQQAARDLTGSVAAALDALLQVISSPRRPPRSSESAAAGLVSSRWRGRNPGGRSRLRGWGRPDPAG